VLHPRELAHRHVVEDGERQAEARALKGARDAGPEDLRRRIAGDAAPGEDQLAGAGGVDPGEHVEEGGLARAVGADEPQHAGLGQLEAERVEGDEAAETPRETLAREQRGGHAAPPASQRRSLRGRRPPGRKSSTAITSTAQRGRGDFWRSSSFSGGSAARAAARAW